MSNCEELEESLARIEEYENLRLRAAKQMKQKCGLGDKLIGIERREKLVLYSNSAIRGHGGKSGGGFCEISGFY